MRLILILSCFCLSRFCGAQTQSMLFEKTWMIPIKISFGMRITLAFDTHEDNVEVSVFSTEGKLIYSNSIFCSASSNIQLAIRLDELSVASGIYILQAKTSDSVIRKKIIVAKAKQ
ncbi:MAG: T9SS type A sorting domain-containing protein [Bacteroidia bacterium]